MSSATVHELKQPKPRAVCSACGTKANCECNVPYVPAGEYAAMMVAKHPEKSNRALAKECGVDESTVRAARKATAGNPAVEPRIGLDGKTRKMPQPREILEEPEEGYRSDIEDELDDDPEIFRYAFLNRVSVAAQFAEYTGPVDEQIVSATEAVANQWVKLAERLEREVTEEPKDVEAELDNNPENFRTAFFLRYDAARRMATYKGPLVDEEILSAALAVAEAWTKLAQEIKQRLEGTT